MLGQIVGGHAIKKSIAVTVTPQCFWRTQILFVVIWFRGCYHMQPESKLA